MNTSDKSYIQALVNDFHLSPAYQSSLQSHYLLHWEISYLKEKLFRDGNLLEHNGVIYIPVIPSWLHTKNEGNVKLSFREPFNHLIPPFVVIRSLS